LEIYPLFLWGLLPQKWKLFFNLGLSFLLFLFLLLTNELWAHILQLGFSKGLDFDCLRPYILLNVLSMEQKGERPVG
jgi:hypothetical protein